MASMFSRLKGGNSHSSSKNSVTTAVAPTKEEILNTLEQFGETMMTKSIKENNNNTRQTEIQNRENINPNDSDWEMVKGEQEKTVLSSGHPHSYSMEWERLFNRPQYLKWIKNQAIAGELRPCRFRSICWRLFLEVLPEDMSGWSARARQDREKYTALKNKLIINPRHAVDSVNISFNNPLSQDEESPWNKFFQDNELRLTIKQDVIRTFPEIAFFREHSMQDALVNILFCFCRTHENLSYKQGMHELLAPLIFVLHYDHQAFLHASESENILFSHVHSDFRPIIQELLDPNFLEHDAYFMFCQVMATVEPWYLAKDFPNFTKKPDIFTSQPFSRQQDLIPSSVIVTKLTRIQDYVLKKFDLELHVHLEQLEIAPQIYGIRWLRLLFGREFPMQDLLMLWDAIFADGIGFDLVDYIFVAMMLYIRELLLACDYAGCLSTLMKFPQVSDAHYFIEKALWLREPNQYPRPPNYCHQVISRSHSSSQTRQISPPQGKRGSSASLSQVEETMYRQRGFSSSSLGRLDPISFRSAQSTPAGYSPVGFSPDETSGQSSPTKFNTLPSRNKARAKKPTKQEQELQHQIASLQGQLNDQAAMCRYCSTKLDIHISRLQEELSRKGLISEDEVMVSLAGMKLVRDILSAKLRFTRNILDDDAEISIGDNHYRQMNTPDSDNLISSGIASGATVELMNRSVSSIQTVDRRRRMFYMSSGETSSAAESPESFNGVSGSSTHTVNLATGGIYELGDYARQKPAAMGGHSGFLPGDKELAMEISSQSSGYAASASQTAESMDESPNPLYTREWEEEDKA